MKKKINEAPYELVGMKYSDYVKWCNHHKYNITPRDTKTMFFKAVKDKSIKKDAYGKIIDGKEYY